MSDQTTYHKIIGLQGAANIELRMYVPNAFEITSQERKLVFAIVDAVREFEVHCAQREAA